MAEHAELAEFWKGVAVGTLFGLAAAAYARGDLRRLFTVAMNMDCSSADSKSSFSDHARDQDLRREAS